MRIFGKTRFEKLNTVLVIMVFLTIILLVFRYFLMGVISLIMLVFVSIWWVRLLSEELVIAFLKRHGGQCTDDELIEEYTQKILVTVSRLEKKKILAVRDKEIALIDLDTVCAFGPQKK